MKVYKVTSAAGMSGLAHYLTPTQWGEGVKNSVELAPSMSGYWCYKDPLFASIHLAELLMYSAMDPAVLWEAEAEDVHYHSPNRLQTGTLITIQQIPFPEFDAERVHKFLYDIIRPKYGFHLKPTLTAALLYEADNQMNDVIGDYLRTP